MNAALQAYAARLRSTPPADLDELRERHAAVVAAGADVVPDWLALRSRLALAGLDALTVGGDPALALSEHAERAAEQAGPEDLEAALANLRAISETSTVTDGLWQRFEDFTAPFGCVEVDDHTDLWELRWHIEEIPAAELAAAQADCELLMVAPDVRDDIRTLAALCAIVAETQLAGELDEDYFLAACLSASELRHSEEQRRDAA